MAEGQSIGRTLARAFQRARDKFRGSNQTGVKSQGRRSKDLERDQNGTRIRINSRRWGGPPRPRAKHRAWKRAKRAGFGQRGGRCNG